MPGHKGALGFDDDLTEVSGADSLYNASGVLQEAEKEAAALFGSRMTCLSTEGSSQVIKAMCCLALNHYRAKGGRSAHPMILATRNAHRSFIYASMLLGFDIKWMSPKDSVFSLCKCDLKPDDLEESINEFEDKDAPRLAAVFVTSPDYLGNLLDIKALSETAHRHGLLLLCDNAHGSYLKFTEEDAHPLSLGADMTSDSAHKTLPVLTGGAFLHISKNAPEGIEKDAKNALLMFGSTSPSYLIMQSLAEGLKLIDKKDYINASKKLNSVKEKLTLMGYSLYGNEPLKLVIDTRNKPFSGPQLAEGFRSHSIECEYADPDFLVTMWSPYNSEEDAAVFLAAAQDLIGSYNSQVDIESSLSVLSCTLPEVRFQPCELLFSPHHTLSVDDRSLIGKVAADALINCPPAVSPIVAGEVFDENVIKILKHYGFETVEVLD